MKRSKPERELTDEERNVLISVRHCARELDDLLQGSRRKSQSSATLFAQSGISFLFRAIESYADMYEKLNLKSREALDRLFQKFSECDEIQDTQDAIEETEGNWRNFLTNLNDEVTAGSLVSAETSDDDIPSYIYLPSLLLIDCQTNKEFDLHSFVRRHTCVFVTCQPAFWPDTCVLWRHSEVTKAKSDLAQFNVNYIVITWGPAECVRPWAKQVTRLTKWTVLWDKTLQICSKLQFRSGLKYVWAVENMDFCGCHRFANRFPVVTRTPTSNNFSWLDWNQIGGELILSTPVVWDPHKVNPHQTVALKKSEDDSSSDEDEELKKTSESLIRELLDERQALDRNDSKICKLHRSSYLSDLMPSGAVYQSALTCYARLHNTPESEVMDYIRRHRRFRTAPDSNRLQFEPTSQLYYDPETCLYYDSTRGYFYDASQQTYYYWSQADQTYVEANGLIQAEMMANWAAQSAAQQTANQKALKEREAASRAARQVAAELAEIRSRKDDYSAYVYATCVLPQHKSDTEPNYSDCLASRGKSGAGASQIETSLKVLNRRPKPLVPYGDDATDDVGFRSTTPPPPGL